MPVETEMDNYKLLSLKFIISYLLSVSSPSPVFCYEFFSFAMIPSGYPLSG